MRFRLSTTKAAWSFLSLPVVMSAAILAGCDSAPDTNSPEAQKQRDERNAVIAKGEEQINKNSKVPLKSIKSGLKGGQPSAK